jgi:hypothetical protein
MNQSNQSPACDRKEWLVAYLYGECDDFERQEAEAHLSTCRTCATELEQLRAVRVGLGEWVPPDRAPGFRLMPQPVVELPMARRAWPIPAWARAAAAVLLVAGGAALANLDVRYGSGGLTIRTGWQHARETAAAIPAKGTTSAPWRADLAALRDQLRNEMVTVQPAHGSPEPGPIAAGAVAASASAGGTGSVAQAPLLRQVRVLIDESERRQQRELALRLADVLRDFETQRRADLVRIEQGMGQIEGRTGAEVAQQRQILNYLVRVSQRQ